MRKKLSLFMVGFLGLMVCAFASTFGLKGTAYHWEVATDISAGDVMVLAVDNGTVAKELSGFTFTNVSIGVATDYTGTPDGAFPLEVETGSESGTFSFACEGGYLSWSDGNSLTVSDTKNANSSWKVTFTDGVPSIVNAADETRKLMYNAGNPRFACYTSAQTAVTLWKKVAGEAPVTTGEYYVVGPEDFFGVAWAIDAENKMTASATAAGVFTKTYQGVEITASESAPYTLLYKFLSADGRWFPAGTNNDMNYVIKQSGIYDITFKLDVNNFSDSNPYEPQNITVTLKEAVVGNIAALNKLSKDVGFTLTGDVLVVAKPTAKYVFIKDDTGSSLIYDNSGASTEEMAVGKTIAGGWQGKVSIYNGLFEAVPVEAPVMSDAPVVTVTYPEVAPEYVSDQHINEVVTLKGVHYSKPEGKNFNITVDGVDIVVPGYNQFGLQIADPDETKTYDMVGAIGIYSKNNKTTIQFQPIEITEAVAPATPDYYVVGENATLFGAAWGIATDGSNKMAADATAAGIFTKTYSNVHLDAGTSIKYKFAASYDGSTIKDTDWYPVEYDNYFEVVVSKAGTYNLAFTFDAGQSTTTNVVGGCVATLVQADPEVIVWPAGLEGEDWKITTTAKPIMGDDVEVKDEACKVGFVTDDNAVYIQAELTVLGQTVTATMKGIRDGENNVILPKGQIVAQGTYLGQNISGYLFGPNASDAVLTASETAEKISLTNAGPIYLNMSPDGAGTNLFTLTNTEIYKALETTTMDYYVAGSMTQWGPVADYKMTRNTANTDFEEYMITLSLKANDEFKVAKSDGQTIDDANWYPSGMGNNFPIVADGEYTIYFRPDGKGGQDWYKGYIFVEYKEEPAETVLWSSETPQELDWSDKILIGQEKFANVKVGDVIRVALTNVPTNANYKWDAQVYLKGGQNYLNVEDCIDVAGTASGSDVAKESASFIITGDILAIAKAQGLMICGQGGIKTAKVTLELAAEALGSDLSVWVGAEHPTGASKISNYHFKNFRNFTGVKVGDIVRVYLEESAWVTLAYNLGWTWTNFADGDIEVQNDWTNPVVDIVFKTEAAVEAVNDAENNRGVFVNTVGKLVQVELIEAEEPAGPVVWPAGLEGEDWQITTTAKTPMGTEGVQDEPCKLGFVTDNNEVYIQGELNAMGTMVTATLKGVRDANNNVTIPKGQLIAQGTYMNQDVSGYIFAQDATGALTDVVLTYSKTNDEESLTNAGPVIVNTSPDGSGISVFTLTNTKIFKKLDAATDYYVAGSMTEWKPVADYKMTLNTAATGEEYMLTLELKANDKFKVAKSDGQSIDDENWYPQNLDNYKITQDGKYTIYFRPNADGGQDWYGGCIFVAMEEEPVGPIVWPAGLEGETWKINTTAQKGNSTPETIEGQDCKVGIIASDAVAYLQIALTIQNVPVTVTVKGTIGNNNTTVTIPNGQMVAQETVSGQVLSAYLFGADGTDVVMTYSKTAEKESLTYAGTIALSLTADGTQPVYTLTNTEVYKELDTPTLEKFYIVSDQDGWSNADEKPNLKEMTWNAETQAFEYSVTVEKDFYFAFGDVATSDSWDDFNANHRYAVRDGEAVEAAEGQPMQLKKTTGDASVKITTTGIYTVSVTKDLVLSIKKTGEVTPVTDHTYIVAGNQASIFGTEWDAANEDNMMEKQADGTFQKTYTVDMAYDDVQLKVVEDGEKWHGDATGNNVTFNLTGAGTFTVTIDPKTNNVVTVTGEIVKFPTELDYTSVFAVGNGAGAWLNGITWNPEAAANKMTEVSDDVWEITFKDVPATNELQVKFAIDGAWTYNFGGTFAAFGQETDAVWNGNNITFTTTEATDITVRLDLTNFNFLTKEGAKFTITLGTEPPVVLNTEALDTEISNAETLLGSADKTVEPGKSLAEAIEAAKTTKTTATTQDEIDAAVETLKAAEDVYKNATLDKSALETEISNAETLLGSADKTTEPGKSLAEAIEAAKTTKTTATTQDEIDAAVETLKAAEEAYNVATGIDMINADSRFDETLPAYNLQGQRVTKSYRGIIIQNGRRFYNK